MNNLPRGGLSAKVVESLFSKAKRKCCPSKGEYIDKEDFLFFSQYAECDVALMVGRVNAEVLSFLYERLHLLERSEYM